MLELFCKGSDVGDDWAKEYETQHTAVDEDAQKWIDEYALTEVRYYARSTFGCLVVVAGAYFYKALTLLKKCWKKLFSIVLRCFNLVTKL